MTEMTKLAAENGFLLIFAVTMLICVIALLKILAGFLQKVWGERETRIANLETTVTTINNGQREAVMSALLTTNKTNSDICRSLDSLDKSVAKLASHIETQPCHMLRDEFVPLLEDLVTRALSDKKPS